MPKAGHKLQCRGAASSIRPFFPEVFATDAETEVRSQR